MKTGPTLELANVSLPLMRPRRLLPRLPATEPLPLPCRASHFRGVRRYRRTGGGGVRAGRIWRHAGRECSAWCSRLPFLGSAVPRMETMPLLMEETQPWMATMQTVSARVPPPCQTGAGFRPRTQRRPCPYSQYQHQRCCQDALRAPDPCAQNRAPAAGVGSRDV